MKIGTKLELCKGLDPNPSETYEGVVVQDSFLHYSVWTDSHNELIKFDKTEMYPLHCPTLQCSTYPKGWRILGVEGIPAHKFVQRYSTTITVYDCEPIRHKMPT